MQTGLAITLPQRFSSDIVSLQDTALGKPNEVSVEPGEFKLLPAIPQNNPFQTKLEWEPSKNAHVYRVTVSDSGDFTHPVAMESAGTSSILVSNLPLGKTFRWKVEAIAWGGTRKMPAGREHSTPEP